MKMSAKSYSHKIEAATVDTLSHLGWDVSRMWPGHEPMKRHQNESMPPIQQQVRNLRIWVNENHDYGLIFLSQNVFEIIRWVVAPVLRIANFMIRNKKGYSSTSALELLTKYILTVAWASLFGMGFVRTRPEPWLARGSGMMKIIGKEKISKDSYTFTLGVDYPNQRLGLNPLKHIRIKAPGSEIHAAVVEGEWNGEEDPHAGEDIIRSYTPSMDFDHHHGSKHGSVKLVIKVYPKTEKFVDGGKMGNWLLTKQIGDYVEVSGPLGLNEYFIGGGFKLGRKKANFNIRTVNMVTGGSGITPALQLVKGVIRDEYKTHPIQLNLINCNRELDDILCKKALDEFAEEYPDQFRVHYTLDNLPTGDDLKPNMGMRSLDAIRNDPVKRDALLGPNGDETVWIICGPPGLCGFVSMLATEMGQPKELICTLG